MKKISRTLGVISIIVLAIGILFKLSHWQGASIIQNVGILGLLAFFVVYLLIGIKPLTTSLEKSVGVAGALTMCLILIAYLFKSMHWPGASILILISQLGLIVTSVLLIIDSIKETDQTKQSIKTLFAFMLVTITAILVFTIHILAHT